MHGFGVPCCGSSAAVDFLYRDTASQSRRVPTTGQVGLATLFIVHVPNVCRCAADMMANMYQEFIEQNPGNKKIDRSFLLGTYVSFRQREKNCR